MLGFSKKNNVQICFKFYGLSNYFYEVISFTLVIFESSVELLRF